MIITIVIKVSVSQIVNIRKGLQRVLFPCNRIGSWHEVDYSKIRSGDPKIFLQRQELGVFHTIPPNAFHKLIRKRPCLLSVKRRSSVAAISLNHGSQDNRLHDRRPWLGSMRRGMSNDLCFSWGTGMREGSWYMQNLLRYVFCPVSEHWIMTTCC